MFLSWHLVFSVDRHSLSQHMVKGHFSDVKNLYFSPVAHNIRNPITWLFIISMESISYYYCKNKYLKCLFSCNAMYLLFVYSDPYSDSKG